MYGCEIQINPKYAEYSEFAKKTVYDSEPFYSWVVKKDGAIVCFYPGCKECELDPIPEGCVIERGEPDLKFIETKMQMNKTLDAIGDLIQSLQKDAGQSGIDNARL